MPTAPRQWSSALKEVHCPLPPGSAAVYCRRSTAHCPQAVRRCIEGGPLPTAPRQWGSVLQELHCPLPPGSEAVHCRNCTAHCPQAVRQCIAGGPLPTAPDNSAAGHTQCSVVQSTKQSAPHRRHWWCSAARRVQWANETLCDYAQASARRCRPSARVHWSGYATTHLHTARTQHTQPSPFTCTRG